ncbi:hypothetical protein OCHUTO_0575 [Orientia chuto str. Dubai]|uniref:Uncharacterized protein n=1 Tax=Orientia chuto str. Dubai TaxID=1359168 RepID=A0A0F3MKM1_9RICK|nr:hypothetical protein OCHUTO_0575 [Orientia chuto str. Dubai]
MHKFLVGLIVSSFLVSSVLANSIPQTQNNEIIENQHNSSSSDNITKILEEYKAYVRTVPENVRTEISDYRAQLHKINQEKQILYNKLSFEAQDYLKKVQSFKKNLKKISNMY